MENKAHAFAAGTFVLVVAALLVAMAVWLTRDGGLQLTYEVSTREAVTGLQPQAGVRFRGVRVGKVMSIGFDPLIPGNVLLRISVSDDAPITRSTFATLGFQGVTGLAFVQLDDTGESKEALRPNDGRPVRIPMRPGLMSQLLDQGAGILSQLQETSSRVNQLLTPDNQKALMGTVQGIGQAAGHIQQLSGNMDAILRAQLGPERVNLPQFVQDATVTAKALTDSAAEVKRSAAELMRVSERLNQPGGAMDKLTEGAGALAATGQTLNAGTLPRLNRTAEEVARTVRQAGRVVSTVNENPQALIFGNGPVVPGPGEPGFAAPGGKP